MRQAVPCSTPEIHHRLLMRILHHHGRHPQKLGWCNHGRCDRGVRTCSRSCPWGPRGIHGLRFVNAMLSGIEKLIAYSCVLHLKLRIRISLYSPYYCVYRDSPPQL
jgi:hypothetical protein